ncbi:KUP/HAK/KT family potassium transporter [Pendulispora rubella]|uniref:Probable potassium transport system protein Kup n=1 Tax=Pendulispora rubella TaxID=2741070 RepID=A0ABZ2LD11_9BACT
MSAPTAAAPSSPSQPRPPSSHRPPSRSIHSLADLGLLDKEHPERGASVRALTLAALGVVFGDIGTSPLYTLRECVHAAEHGGPATQAGILGLLSLMFWSLTMVVTVKYLTFIMRANNHGEGGILALLALVPEKLRQPQGQKVGWVAVLVLVGAALLYGDGIITPSISVLSAVEGLETAAPGLKRAVVPITCAILIGLFYIQRRGTADVGRFFGPIMVVWFATLFGLGAYHIVEYPAVLQALSPHYAVNFFLHHGWHGFVTLGAVVLCVTGGEALYADMGHFGTRPIRLAWWLFAMPALVVNYFGQGALVLSHPEALENPFFSQLPTGPLTYALVALSTLASIIASQALISGAYSLTHQAVQLGYFPRVTVKHTSHETEGQIYIPQINWGLMVACLIVVLQFQKSSALAAAYGIAVTGTMGITSIVYYVVVRRNWGWSRWKALPLVVLFLCFDIPFFAANLLKFFEGGYVPIIFGAAVFSVMLTWKIGRSLLGEYIVKRSPPMDEFLAGLHTRLVARIPGTAIFMASNSGRVPPILFHHAQRIRVLHDTVILLTVVTEHVPVSDEERRLEVQDLGEGFYRVIARCGFMEAPNVPEILHEAAAQCGVPVDFSHMTYYVGRETFLASGSGKMGKWQEMLFAFLSRNAQPATRYFGIPHEHVVELGTQIDL